MVNIFDKIAANAQVEFLKTAAGTQAWAILNLLNQLIATLQTSSVFTTLPDNRDAIITRLQAEVASLNSLSNNTASILQAIKDALRAPDATGGDLAVIVAGVMAERDALRNPLTPRGIGLQ